MGKGEIARYEQFLLFPQCFQTTCSADTEKLGLVWERDRLLCYGRPLLQAWLLSDLNTIPDNCVGENSL